MCICEKCIHCEVCDEWSKEFLHRTLLYPVENENDCDHYKSKKEYNIEIVKEFAAKLKEKTEEIEIPHPYGGDMTIDHISPGEINKLIREME